MVSQMKRVGILCVLLAATFFMVTLVSSAHAHDFKKTEKSHACAVCQISQNFHQGLSSPKITAGLPPTFSALVEKPVLFFISSSLPSSLAIRGPPSFA